MSGIGPYLFEDGEAGGATNRHQALDPLVAGRGRPKPAALRLIEDLVRHANDATVAIRSGRPRPFDRPTFKGTSDPVPRVARLVL